MENKKAKIGKVTLVLCLLFLVGCEQQADAPKQGEARSYQQLITLNEQQLKEHQNMILTGDCSDRATSHLFRHYSKGVGWQKGTERNKELTKWSIEAAKSGCLGMHKKYATKLLQYGIQHDNKDLIDKALQLMAIDTNGDLVKGLGVVSVFSWFSECTREGQSAEQISNCESFFKNNPEWREFFSAFVAIQEYHDFLYSNFNANEVTPETKGKVAAELAKQLPLVNQSMLKIQSHKDPRKQNLVRFWFNNKSNMLDTDVVDKEVNKFYRRDGDKIKAYPKEQRQLMKTIVEETVETLKPSLTITFFNNGLINHSL